MMVSKSKLKAQMLSIFRSIERTGEEVIVTDRGKPTLKIARLPRGESVESVFGEHRASVVYGEDILLPTGNEWKDS